MYHMFVFLRVNIRIVKNVMKKSDFHLVIVCKCVFLCNHYVEEQMFESS